MKNTILVIVLFIFIGQISLAQDVISFKTGEASRGMATEITATEIKYKKEDNLAGPAYTILKSKIVSIQYENGTIDDFGAKPKASQIYTESSKEKKTSFDHVRFSGPRIGLTVIGNGTTHDYIVDTFGKKPIISQFG